MSNKPVVIIGGGPAGSTAALCLRKLGREAIVLEREAFPRYRIGESLLPGTLSILHRLGVIDEVHAAGFPRKKAATFLWGKDRSPWSFTFSTPDTAPWVYDHSYQVTRSEFDKILLDAAAGRGADVRVGVNVTEVLEGLNGADPVVRWSSEDGEGEIEASFVLDASGAAGIVAKRLGVRRYDPYYKNLAVWSYWKGGKRFGGDIGGNIFSVSFRDGWMWLIPMKDDLYSVGVVTGAEFAQCMKEVGPEKFYEESIKLCDFATEVLEPAERVEDVRVVRDWAYDAETLAVGKFFLCGDSGCFIDPLFSQGVHLATYSAMNAAAAVDHALKNPDAVDDVRGWYNDAYHEAYNRYHRFLSAFYANCDEEDSAFWSQRRLQAGTDHRFEGRDWYRGLAGQDSEDEAAIRAVEESAQTLTRLWNHGTEELTEEFDETTLSLRRVAWFTELVREYRKMKTMRWASEEVKLYPSFRVDKQGFHLEPVFHLGNEHGDYEPSLEATEEHRTVFASLADEPLSYVQLTKALRPLSGQQESIQMVRHLVEGGFLIGLDADGNRIRPAAALRFGGVGADDDMS